MGRIDLHVHSVESCDGDVEPDQLVALAKQAGVKVMAVADHNNTRAVGRALAAGEALGVTVVPAIEIDCHLDGLSLHILGYGIRHDDPAYAALGEDVDVQYRNASLEQLDRIADLGIAVDRAAIMAEARNGIATGEHIAEMLFAEPANRDNPLLAPYYPGGAKSDNPYVSFYWDICAPGKPAHVPMRFMSLDEAVTLITGTGGVAVLAHPGVSLAGGEDMLPKVLERGVEGVEAFSSYHDPAACTSWFDRARRAGALVTCGSDFHGKFKPPIRLGVHGGDDHELLAWDRLLNRLS